MLFQQQQLRFRLLERLLGTFNMLVNSLAANLEFRGYFAKRIIVVEVKPEKRLLLLRQQRSVYIEQHIDAVRLAKRLFVRHRVTPSVKEKHFTLTTIVIIAIAKAVVKYFTLSA